LCESAGDKSLSDARGSRDDEVVLFLHPAARG
jgi:hypothetical protein